MNVSDVKVWDAPSIGRNDGMSVETKCYQHVVIWADYAKALMKVEDERDEANRVCEQWRQWTVATRANNEALRARVAELEKALQFMLNVFGQDGLGDGAEGDAVEHARKAMRLPSNKEGSRDE